MSKKALEESIALWEAKVATLQQNMGKCIRSTIYTRIYCVDKQTGKNGCDSTPYYDVIWDGRIDDRIINSFQTEVDFLKSLRSQYEGDTE